MAPQPVFAVAWFRQREAGVRAVAAIESEELRTLSAAEGLRLADALLSATPIEAVAAERRNTSGFVVQQRLFLLARR